MLNLRDADNDPAHVRSDGNGMATRSTIRFNASVIIGNIGEDLDFGRQSDSADNDGGELNSGDEGRLDRE